MKIRNRTLQRFVTWLLVKVVSLLYWTCRKRSRMEAAQISPYADTGDARYLYSIWHDQLTSAIFMYQPLHMSGLVSQHRDGSYVSDTMEMCGVLPVRGSTNRGGSRALRELLDLARDCHVAITPDGPRGPRRKVSEGIVFLASHSGRSIVPIAFGCNRCWRFKGSWTDLMIPKPFSILHGIAGRPLSIPSNLSREQLAQHTAILQDEMDRLQRDAELLAAGKSLPEPVIQQIRAAA